MHAESLPPSSWVCRFAPLIRPRGRVLDLACGSGRHARWLAARSWEVEAVDADPTLLVSLAGSAGIRVRCADLEADAWPCAMERFDGIVVTNYLHRPLFPRLCEVLAPGGVLIYETFMEGNERFGRPRNPAFLLREGELLERVAGRLRVVAFEQGEVARPAPAMVQRLCAVRSAVAVRLPESPVPGC
ncbi:MAG: class I SAM-dependent methyltransferase [Betaproteobacteria bacterium]|nr:class I SAM-dependent methyltransferase [Betaproteobacteria bacterium]